MHSGGAFMGLFGALKEFLRAPVVDQDVIKLFWALTELFSTLVE